MKVQERINDKVYAHWNEILAITPEMLTRADGTFRTLSVTNGGMYEVMIFIDCNAENDEFAVTIYKAEPGIIFGPNAFDKFTHYELGEEFDIFFFTKFEDVKEFISLIPNDYPEYRKRPYRRIEESA